MSALTKLSVTESSFGPRGMICAVPSVCAGGPGGAAPGNGAGPPGAGCAPACSLVMMVATRANAIMADSALLTCRERGHLSAAAVCLLPPETQRGTQYAWKAILVVCVNCRDGSGRYHAVPARSKR